MVVDWSDFWAQFWVTLWLTLGFTALLGPLFRGIGDILLHAVSHSLSALGAREAA